jgi:hypothetical protein
MEQNFSENNELKYTNRLNYSTEYYTLLNINNEETCYQLYWDVANERIPLDTNVRKKFGFDKCNSKLEEAYLLMVYYDCFMYFRPDILILKKIYSLHEAYVNNNLFEYIIYLAQYTDNLESEYFKWFISKPKILNKY